MNLEHPLDPVEHWDELVDRARALLHGEAHSIANAANLSALIFHSLTDLNWVGFYFAEGEELVVGPFQGLPACVRIPFGRGVCGVAAAEQRTQRVADVRLRRSRCPWGRAAGAAPPARRRRLTRRPSRRRTTGGCWPTR